MSIYFYPVVMSSIAVEGQERQHERKLTMIRLVLLLTQLIIILSNRSYDTSQILAVKPELSSLVSVQFRAVEHAFRAANTLGLVFLVMELIVLYVGTNRFRLKPTIFSAILHIFGSFFYWHHSQWQFDNMWVIFYLFSFLPLVSEIAVAVYTAKA